MKRTIERFQLTYCNNTTYVIAPATWDSDTGKVTGLCVAHSVTNRLFHAVSHQVGTMQGKEITLPVYKKISAAEFGTGYCDECYL